MGALTAGGVTLIVLGILLFIGADFSNAICLSSVAESCYGAASYAANNMYSSPFVQGEIFGIIMLLSGVPMVIFGSRSQKSRSYSNSEIHQKGICESCRNPFSKLNWYRGKYLCDNCYNRYIGSQRSE